MERTFDSLMVDFNLAEEDYNSQVSEHHIVNISRTCCRTWRSLPSLLELRSIVMDDIDRGPGSEEDKRRSFLLKWREMKGSEATYRKLIKALLETDCVQDAESVCKLLKQSTSSLSPDHQAAVSKGMYIRWNVL